MVEQITAKDHYELMKVLATCVDPAEFPQNGLTCYGIKEGLPGSYTFITDGCVYHDDSTFMRSIKSDWQGYFFVVFEPKKIVLGFSGHKIMGEYIWADQSWKLIEYEDFRRPHQSAAEIKFEIGNGYQNLKKALSQDDGS